MHRLLLVLAPLLVLLTGCPRRLPAAPAAPAGGAAAPAAQPAARGAPALAAPGGAASPLAPERLEELRAGADAVLRAQAELYWRLFTHGESPDPAAPWAGREPLRSASTLAAIDDAHAIAQGPARRGLANLRAWVAGERLARESAEAGRRATAAHDAATFTWDGREVPLRDARRRLAGEHSAERRRALAEAAARAAAPALAADAERAAAVADAAAALGHREPLGLAAAVRDADPAAMGALAEATLARTEALWRGLVEELGRREGLAAGEVRSCDLPRLLRTATAPSAFPEDRQLESGAALLEGLGIDLAAQQAEHVLRVDAAARPRKLPRAIALPVDPPRDVRLSTAPVAGIEALRGFLHELGVAQAYLHVRAEPPELRRLGSGAVMRTWGIVFEEVAGAPAWLEARGLPREVVAEEAQVAAARRLLRAREAAGRLLLEVARQGERSSPEARRIAERALGVPLAPEEVPWWWERDPLLRSADALRAELLAAQLEQHLASRAGGAAWWRAPASGAWLATAWAEGGARTAEDLSLAAGRRGLDPVALVEVVTRRAGK